MGSTTDVVNKPLDLNTIALDDEVRILDTNADSWYLRRASLEEPLNDLVAGFTIRSTNPAWIRLKGTEPSLVHHICRTVEVGQHFPIGGIDITVAEIRRPS